MLVQHHNMPEYDDALNSNFVLRLFKSTNLLELGIDQNKNTTINFIKRLLMGLQLVLLGPLKVVARGRARPSSVR